jgi:hypothetical protein
VDVSHYEGADDSRAKIFNRVAGRLLPEMATNSIPHFANVILVFLEKLDAVTQCALVFFTEAISDVSEGREIIQAHESVRKLLQRGGRPSKKVVLPVT